MAGLIQERLYFGGWDQDIYKARLYRKAGAAKAAIKSIGPNKSAGRNITVVTIDISYRRITD